MEGNALFARQPIFDRENKLFGFELLYRGDIDLQSLSEGVKATTTVLINYCTGLMETKAQDTKPIFLNVDEAFITSDLSIPVPPDKLVLEVLETVKVTNQSLEAISNLHERGYTIALDDYSFDGCQRAFLPFISILKIDVLSMSPEQLEHHLSEIDLTGKVLLAEKVENKAMYDRCVALGFTLFQGFYLERPSVIRGKTLSTNEKSMLHLIFNLTKEDITVNEISDIIATDPSLVVKLLRIVNCPLFPFRREIVEIREAVIKLGLNTVKQWAVILSFTTNSSQPNELFRTLLVRAKACELYATSQKKENSQEFFIIGLFSGIDVVLGIEMKELLNAMSFPEHIVNEIVPEHRDRGGILSYIMAFENSHSLDKKIEISQESLIDINSAYWSGAKWADELMQYLVFD